ncbi:MAG TPA: methylenetetrahydrofolate--tRNA-(uracil(54)-C(5))-methyltransferase (FADH(2)-oxidizing) TrmFO, partial [Armatimonadetes bacterium]|nr:methylenetetrahydrofolate--tRNA-(uracil(54)-C(5))-methyltransferase (FADH(2)-oxidizing) TrmFO [Armatimonadota bacterium]
MNERISVIGGGLAGCAAALAAAKHGAAVTLFEQRPATTPETHQTTLLSELAGTADLGVEDLDRATGLLKAELRALCPEMMVCIEEARIGERTVAVGRRAFAQEVTARVTAAGVELRREEVLSLPEGP